MKGCSICGKPVVLVPSAAERAKRYGGTAAQYEALFPRHATCELASRAELTQELMQRIAAAAPKRPRVAEIWNERREDGPDGHLHVDHGPGTGDDPR